MITFRHNLFLLAVRIFGYIYPILPILCNAIIRDLAGTCCRIKVHLPYARI